MHAVKHNSATLLTAPGAAAIAVIRIHGSGAQHFLSTRFSRIAAIGKCVHGELRDEQAQIIDDPVVVLISDLTADVSVHGGTWVVHQVLALLQRDGFAIVDSAAATPDAAGELDAAVERSLPFARTELAVRALLAQPQAWKHFDPANAADILPDQALWWLLNPPRVAIIGAPNVGKSTLANQLFGQERSIVADVPGTTRDWVGELADVNGLVVMLLDTPGVRHTADLIERQAIERSVPVVKDADLVVIVLDATRGIDDQRGLLAHWPTAMVVVNKSDRADLPLEAIRTVATDGRGVEELRRAICRHFGCDRLNPSKPRWWLADQQESLRHRLAASK